MSQFDPSGPHYHAYRGDADAISHVSKERDVTRLRDAAKAYAAALREVEAWEITQFDTADYAPCEMAQLAQDFLDADLDADEAMLSYRMRRDPGLRARVAELRALAIKHACREAGIRDMTGDVA